MKQQLNKNTFVEDHQNLTTKEIASKYGFSCTTVHRYAQRLKLKAKKRGRSFKLLGIINNNKEAQNG